MPDDMANTIRPHRDRPHSPTLEPMMSVREVADILGVPTSCIYYLVKAHGLPVRKIGKYFRFYQHELVRWIEERKER